MSVRRTNPSTESTTARGRFFDKLDEAMKRDFDAKCVSFDGSAFNVYESKGQRFIVEVLLNEEWNVYSHTYYSGPKRGTS